MFFSYCGQLLYSVLFCQQSCCPHICKQKIKLIYHIFRTCRICDRCCRSYGTCGACGAGWTGCSYWSICTNRTGCTWTPLWPGWACCSRHTNWSLDSLRPCCSLGSGRTLNSLWSCCSGASSWSHGTGRTRTSTVAAALTLTVSFSVFSEKLHILIPAKIFLSLGYAQSVFPVPFTSDNNSQMYIGNLYLLFD